MLRTELLKRNSLNSILDEKILDWSKLKASVDNKVKIAHMTEFMLDRVEKLCEKKKIDYMHFLLFLQGF